MPTKPKPPDPVPAPQPKPMVINPAPPIPRPINPPSLFQQSPMQQQQQQQLQQQQQQLQQQQQQIVRALLPSPLQGQQNPGTARPIQPPPAQPLRPMLPQFQSTHVCLSFLHPVYIYDTYVYTHTMDMYTWQTVHVPNCVCKHL